MSNEAFEYTVTTRSVTLSQVGDSDGSTVVVVSAQAPFYENVVSRIADWEAQNLSYEEARKQVELLAGRGANLPVPVSDAADRGIVLGLNKSLSMTGEGTLLMRGVELDGGLADRLVSMIETDEGNWTALAAMIENMAELNDGPKYQEVSRFLSKNDFAVTTDGRILGYKAVTPDHAATHAGYCTVIMPDGERIDYIDQTPRYPIGSIAMMSKSDVAYTPNSSCGTGLHIGSRRFVQDNYGGYGDVLVAAFWPEHVSSVPTDSHSGKIRTIQFEVLAKLDHDLVASRRGLSLTSSDVRRLSAVRVPEKTRAAARIARENLIERSLTQKGA